MRRFVSIDRLADLTAEEVARQAAYEAGYRGF
jgi:hypothetical protein